MCFPVTIGVGYTISKDKPLARLMLIPNKIDITTKLVDLEEEPEQKEKYLEWSKSRSKNLSDLENTFKTGNQHGPVVIDKPATHWEKDYYLGKHKDGTKQEGHITKVKYPTFTRN